MGVLADDLTGALASAARLREGKWRPLVVWRETFPSSPANAVVVDMRTRDYGTDPGRRAQSWGRYLRSLGCTWIELRIDSTLRGDPAAELAGVLSGAGLRHPTVLAVPAFPEAGRTVVNGHLRAPVGLPGGDPDVARVLFGDGAQATLLPVDLVGRGPMAVAGSVRSLGESGQRYFVADATCEAHLRTLAGAAQALINGGMALLTVSPGAWLRHVRATPESSYVLVVLSSNTSANHEQLAALRGSRPTVVISARDIVSGKSSPYGPRERPAAQTVVIETITETVSDEGEAWLLSAMAARAAGQVLEEGLTRNARCAGIVVGGGQTASAVMDVLGTAHLVAEREIAPLCPRARVAGGAWADLPVITKGGLVGGPGTLALLVDTLWKEHA